MRTFALTTIDNPFDPFEHFDEWYQMDEELGHHTCAYLDRIAKTAPSLSDEELDEELERAIDDIVKNNPLGIYIKVVKESESDQKPIENYLKELAEDTKRRREGSPAAKNGV